jgi:hypothetical protein
MGLLDFLRRKQPGVSGGPSPNYAFVHVYLRQLALSDPLRFLAVAASPQVSQFVESVRQAVAEVCGRPPTFDAASVTFHLQRINGFPSVVVEFPEPRAIAEAHMVAFVVMVDTASEKPPAAETVTARYFTLEKGLSLTSTPRTVLAEWDSTTHSNYGDGPPAEVPAFVEAITGFVDPARPTE